jgi:hypothetical protein
MAKLVEQSRLSFGKAPIVFVGEPRRCVGVVEVHNPHDEPVKMRRLRLQSADSKLQNSCEPEVIDAQVIARLCACETKRVEVSLAFPPTTPPGHYQAWLGGLDGARCPVSIRLLELRSLRLSPGRVSHTTSPGATFETCITVTNLGNVPLTIPHGTPLVFRDPRRGWHQHFHASVTTHGEQGNQQFLDDFLKRMAAAEPPVGRTKIKRGSGVLAPAESRVLEIEVCMPKKLHAPCNYVAFANLGDGTLTLALHLEKPVESPEPPIG